MKKLWQKTGTKTAKIVHKYIISENLTEDQILLPYDIIASIAHVKMLNKIKILNDKEVSNIIGSLKEIYKLNEMGNFQLAGKYEDCHSAIENFLIEKLGDIGKKIHTGRSRNDQILVAIRLYTKDKIKELEKASLSLAKQILKFSKKYEFVAMPGYTHTQQAMPSSVGQWAGNFIEALLDDLKLLQCAFSLNDQNPLGSASGFGTSINIDREETTKLLNFAKTQVNSLYCQNSRGKFESFTISSLSQLMMTLGKIANDIIWFTSYEFNFFQIDKSLTTGSSIMPQKQNLDILEVLRANVSVIMSYDFQIKTAYHNLFSGYNKDLKISKHALIESFNITLNSINVIETVFKKIKPNINKLKKSFSKDIFATDLANEMVSKGIPFREAYKQVGENLNKIKIPDLQKNLKSKISLGAPGNLGLNFYEKELLKNCNEIINF